MAPDRGLRNETHDNLNMNISPSPRDTHFTFRGVTVGLLIGIIICFSNTYFGLQTGWISGMAMPSALLGFSYFKLVSRLLSYPFTPEENVLVQSVAGSVGTMPLGCGFVGVIPALEYLLKPEENGPFRPGLVKLIVWALGIAFFGVVFAVPLRRQVILREQLKFPSGTAAAALIALLHGKEGHPNINEDERVNNDSLEQSTSHELPNLTTQSSRASRSRVFTVDAHEEQDEDEWKRRIRLLLISFGISAFYTVLSYFIPLNNVHLFGSYLANQWLWTVNFSPAYVGQGIIMGPHTTFSMLLGAIIGYAILSPIAKQNGWAPGKTDDWAHGSKGWVVWISLAIMLSDSLVNLAWLIFRPVFRYIQTYGLSWNFLTGLDGWKHFVSRTFSTKSQYSAVANEDDAQSLNPASVYSADEDVLPEHLITNRTALIGLVLSCVFCIFGVHFTFGNMMPFILTILSLVFAMLLSVMGVRALGETDLNPVSGISKLTQLIFALLTPKNNKNAIVINLIAGALSESGALQAGDLMQDLKAGHLIGASPKAQFYGQIIGSAVGAVISAAVYKLYTRVYEIPSNLFQIPVSYVWIYTARLVTGDGLPPKVAEFAVIAGLIFAISTSLRIWLKSQDPSIERISSIIPGGVAVAVGMYNSPSFTLTRAVGGFISWYWLQRLRKNETPILVIASGLILGEGLFSIVNLGLASLKIPHF